MFKTSTVTEMWVGKARMRHYRNHYFALITDVYFAAPLFYHVYLCSPFNFLPIIQVKEEVKASWRGRR